MIIGNEYAKSCTVSPGNHFASNNSHSCQPKILPLHLSHVPIRSSEQLINKAILGSYSLRLKPDRANGEGFHWDLMAKIIRDKNFKMNHSDIADIAARYALPNDPKIETPSLLIDGPRIGITTDSIEFKDLAEINNVKSFDAFISGIVDMGLGKRGL